VEKRVLVNTEGSDDPAQVLVNSLTPTVAILVQL